MENAATHNTSGCLPPHAASPTAKGQCFLCHDDRHAERGRTLDAGVYLKKAFCLDETPGLAKTSVSRRRDARTFCVDETLIFNKSARLA